MDLGGDPWLFPNPEIEVNTNSDFPLLQQTLERIEKEWLSGKVDFEFFIPRVQDLDGLLWLNDEKGIKIAFDGDLIIEPPPDTSWAVLRSVLNDITDGVYLINRDAHFQALFLNPKFNLDNTKIIFETYYMVGKDDPVSHFDYIQRRLDHQYLSSIWKFVKRSNNDNN